VQHKAPLLSAKEIGKWPNKTTWRTGKDFPQHNRHGPHIRLTPVLQATQRLRRQSSHVPLTLQPL
jgi:hypothetical protein